MKNNEHLAFRTNFNYPIHLGLPDAVNDHVNDRLRLICMNPGEFPRLRPRDILNHAQVREEFTTPDGLKIKILYNLDGTTEYVGKLVNDKYYFTDAVLNYSMPLEMVFASFKEHGMKPMIQRQWSWEYPSSFPFYYTLVEEDAVENDYYNLERYYPVEGYEELGIDCLADLLAYSYKFTWDHRDMKWTAITDAHEITKRIRKPWTNYLLQYEYGEQPNTTADLHRVLTFLVGKVNEAGLLSAEEQNALSSFTRQQVEVDELMRLNDRNKVLDAILKAYHDPKLIVPGEDVRVSDPLFAFMENLWNKNPDARYP